MRVILITEGRSDSRKKIPKLPGHVDPVAAEGGSASVEKFEASVDSGIPSS